MLRRVLRCLARPEAAIHQTSIRRATNRTPVSRTFEIPNLTPGIDPHPYLLYRSIL
jgi:hypothetical protein